MDPSEQHQDLYSNVHSMYNISMLMTVTEARARMREALEHVKAGEEVELSQNGQVIAVLVHPSKLRSQVRTPNTIAAENFLENLKRARTERRPLQPVLSPAFAEELANDLRRERDGEWE
jgi:antitoxin (DNA-binding transcriptional repressor) of toxin-antitoxin stability system